MSENQDYLLTEDEITEMIAGLDRIIEAKVSYNKDKLEMAEDCIGEMTLHAKLMKSKLLKLRGGCCGQ